MKRFTLLIGAALAALFISGCASVPPAQQPHAQQSDPREAIAATVAACAASIERIATAAGGDPGSRVAAVGAIERMCGAQGAAQLAALNSAPPAQPASLGQTLWTAAIQTADLLLRGYGIKANRDVNIANSNNNRDVSLASYQAFVGMGAQIAAGYPYVQAPGAVTTTTTTNNTTSTLSGTGVLGSGTYTGPVTTTRTCSGGQAGSAAAGDPTAGPVPGGAGGQATC